MPFLTAPGHKASITELQTYRSLGLLRKVPSLQGQGRSAVVGGPGEVFVEEEALQRVWEKKESDPPHTLGRTSQARENGAGMAHAKPGTSASRAAGCTGTLAHADIQQHISQCAR